MLKRILDNAHVRRLGTFLSRFELEVLLAAALVLAGVWIFVAVADEVLEGESQKFDERVVLAMRQADKPSEPIGPLWLREAARDVTALGGVAVLVISVLAVSGFLILKRHWGALAMVVLASSGAGILSSILKAAFGRERPSVVPPLVEVSSASFPSGHAMFSATIYLAMGVLLAQLTTRRREKIYILAMALLLAVLVGLTRIYLGVHYPTDVLAGWAAGLAWAMICLILARSLKWRGNY